ncbi:hypothetical protein EJ02DRAFT_511750 [Clathrospora elynae]|uniref:Uncharacterized protein n=1 Tax=Clathrospora elynae TaxID=706981 RepID=A0A6A5SZG4_9PLEO|nr:hypothetical protein EJ02DRAFT_511750 [Clathrospora elynae]
MNIPLVPITRIDPEADYAISLGFMRVRVKQFLSGALHGKMLSELLPLSQPSRQIVLEQIDHFEIFLQCLRKAELKNGVRIMPGQVFAAANNVQVTALRGFHGLSIRVVVNAGCLERAMKPLLEHFRMFHGLLNEGCITGEEDSLHARGIEASIAAPRNAENTTFHEFISRGTPIPMMGHPGLDGSPLQELRAIENINHVFVRLQGQGKTVYASVGAAERASPRDDIMLLLSFDNTHPEMVGICDLIFGLHCIFGARVDDESLDKPERLGVVRYGMDLVEQTVGNFEHRPAADTVLYRDAIEMCVMPLAYDSFDNKATFIESIATFSTQFATMIDSQRRLLKWAVPPSLIPPRLLERGILELMADC